MRTVSLDCAAVEPEVADETLQQIHAAEQRALLRRAALRSLFLIAAIMAWWSTGPRPSNPLFVFVGVAGIATAGPAHAYWKRRGGPVRMSSQEAAKLRDEALDEAAHIAERMARRGAPVTWGLVIALVAIALYQVVSSGLAASIEAGGLVHARVLAGEWWRLLSATYLHGSWWHINGNAGALLVLGTFMEAFAPRWRLPLVYLCAGVAATLLSLLLLDKTSIGASGAILGLAGYLLALSRCDPNVLPKGVKARVLASTGLTAVVGAFGYAFIDNAAHAGGFIIGASIGFIDGRWPTFARRVLAGAGVASLAILIIGALGTTIVIHRRADARVAEPVVQSVVPSIVASGGALIIRLTNNRDAALEAYQVEVRNGRKVLETAWRDDCCFTPVNRIEPLAAHSSRDIELSALETRLTLGPPTLHVSYAEFADGTFEGSTRQYDLMRAQRRWVADDADYWLVAVDAERHKPYRDWRASMLARLDARAALSPFGRPSATALGVRDLWDLDPMSPERFAAAVDRHVAAITGVRDQLRRRLAQGAPER